MIMCRATTAIWASVAGSHLCRSLSLVALSAMTFSSTGCSGGAMSASDMRKYAIKRTASDESEKNTEASPVANAAPASEASESVEPVSDSSHIDGNVSAAPTNQATSLDQPPAGEAPVETIEDGGGRVAGEQVSDTKSAPLQPLTAAERAAISAANIRRIAEALEAYRDAEGAYPARSITDRSGAELLSWRVAILPYLGYEELYQQFQTAQPWFSAANKPLAKMIPSVYQSPERFDDSTNFLAVTGGSTIFASKKQMLPALIEDGVEHTAFVVEADDAMAAPWTQPQEYQFSRDNPLNGLGDLRSGYFFVAWGGRNAGAVPVSTTRGNLIAMFTADAGESFSSHSVNMPLDDDLFSSMGDATTASTAAVSPVAVESGAKVGLGATNNAARIEAVVREPSNSLASEYESAARTAYQAGEVSAALKWYYASRILMRAKGSWHGEYQWSPGLRRPSLTIHFCVGVQGMGRGAERRNHRGGSSSRHRSDVIAAVGPAGGQLLEMIEEHAARLVPSAMARGAAASSLTGRRDSQPTLAPVSYLLPGTRTALMQQASESACDVLLLFEIEQGPGRESARSLEIEMYDLAAGRRMTNWPALYWIDSAAGRVALSRDDGFRSIKFRLEDVLRDELSFTEWPAAVTPHAAEKRVSSLGDSKAMHPLAAMAEMSVYRARGLVSGTELLNGLRELVGRESAEELLLGDASEHRRILREWLPTIDVDQLAQHAQRQQRRRDDDD